jgi:hypothetical protein
MARPQKAESSSANLGFEARLWLAADTLRNSMDAAATHFAGLRERRFSADIASVRGTPIALPEG